MGKHPKEGRGRRCGEINVPLRSETALHPPHQHPPLIRERVQDEATGPGLWEGHLIHPPASEPAWRRHHLLPQAPVHGVVGWEQEREAQRS